jgi:hypothetical protein
VTLQVSSAVPRDTGQQQDCNRVATKLQRDRGSRQEDREQVSSKVQQVGAELQQGYSG